MKKMADKKDDILGKLIKPDLLEPVPVDFTNKVMAGLGIEPAKPAFIFKPVISKKGWMLISVVILGIYSWLLSRGGSANEESVAAMASKVIMQQVENAFAATFSGSGMIFIALASAAIFLLFLGESLFRQSRMKTFHI